MSLQGGETRVTGGVILGEDHLFDPYETLGNSYVNKYFIAERANTLIDPQDAKQMAEAMRALKADEHSSG